MGWSFSCTVITIDSELREQRETGKVKREKKKSVGSAIGQMGYGIINPSRGNMSSSNPKRQKPASKTNPATIASHRRSKKLTTLQE